MFCKIEVQKFIKSTYKKVKTTQQKKKFMNYERAIKKNAPFIGGF